MKKNIFYLAEHVKTKINLIDFLENEVSCDFSRTRSEEHGSCICPMPFHNDSAPSFHVRKNEDDVFVYQCFGCGSKGTIIDFFMDYYECDDFMESLNLICEKFKIENTNDLVLTGLKNITKKIDSNRKLDNAHILTSNLCRSLLQKNYKYKDWVLEQYEFMNQALEEEDILMIEEVGSQASRKLREQ